MAPVSRLHTQYSKGFMQLFYTDSITDKGPLTVTCFTMFKRFITDLLVMLIDSDDLYHNRPTCYAYQ